MVVTESRSQHTHVHNFIVWVWTETLSGLISQHRIGQKLWHESQQVMCIDAMNAGSFIFTLGLTLWRLESVTFINKTLNLTSTQTVTTQTASCVVFTGCGSQGYLNRAWCACHYVADHCVVGTLGCNHVKTRRGVTLKRHNTAEGQTEQQTQGHFCPGVLGAVSSWALVLCERARNLERSWLFM